MAIPTLTFGCFARIDLLALDDWLRDPLTRPQSQGLLEIVDDRHDGSSIVLFTMPNRLALKGESRRKTDSPLPMPTT